jgi:hypothetical protein
MTLGEGAIALHHDSVREGEQWGRAILAGITPPPRPRTSDGPSGIATGRIRLVHWSNSTSQFWSLLRSNESVILART